MTDTKKTEDQQQRAAAVAFARVVAAMPHDRRQAALKEAGASLTTIEGDLGTVVVMSLNQKLPGITICE